MILNTMAHIINKKIVSTAPLVRRTGVIVEFHIFFHTVLRITEMCTIMKL